MPWWQLQNNISKRAVLMGLCQQSLTANKAIILPFSLQILDVNGKNIRNFQLAPGMNWELNLQDLPAATYVVHASGAFGQLSIKWVKYQ